MAVIKAVSSKAGIGHAIDYVTKKEKTEEKLAAVCIVSRRRSRRKCKPQRSCGQDGRKNL